MAIIKVADLGISSGVNKPSFLTVLSADFTLVHNTHTLVPFNETWFNDDNCYDTTNYKFTASTSGRYVFYATTHIDDTDSTHLSQAVYYINGVRDVSIGSLTNREFLNQAYSSGSAQNQIPQPYAIFDLNADDYVQLYARQTSGASQVVSGEFSYFCGYKLIGT